ncbi:MAG TPA: FxsA family protein [Telmatospirillum sp.]|nr:FxsA family protein [Telmatospirillum sp.]
MAWVFPLFFLAWPVVEIAVLIKIAGWLGWPGAIIGIVLSGMAGVALLRRQGLTTAQLAQTQLRQGEMPIGPLFDGACLALAGGLLLLPGFVTDLLALPLLFPPFRHLLRRLLAKRFVVQTRSASAGPAVIEGEWTVVKEEDPHRPDHDRLG